MNEDMNRTDRDHTHSAGMNARRDRAGRLARLEDLDNYKIADGQPDIRGWKVKTTDGTEVGKVTNLIADTGTMDVRYVETRVKPEVLGTSDDECVLIPIGAARLNDDDDTVIVDRLPAAGLRGAPRFGQGPVAAEHEQALAQYHGAAAADTPEARAHFFGNRRPAREHPRYLVLVEERIVETRPVKERDAEVRRNVDKS